MLDCKNEKCIEIFNKDEIKNVVLKDFICDECKEHFEEVKKYLDKTGIKYEIDKMLVRGLDYYTRTVLKLKAAFLALKVQF